MKERLNLYVADIVKAYEFARDMKGHHNDNMVRQRGDRQIFIDDFRGKLAEIALKRYLEGNGHIVGNIDFNIYNRGEWDKNDLIIDDNINISVKSSGLKANYLMIETHRFNADGTYSYKNHDGSEIKVDYYAFLNIGIGDEDESGYTEYTDGIAFMGVNDRNSTWQDVPEKRKAFWCYLKGFISHEDFWRLKKKANRGIYANLSDLNEVWDGNFLAMRPDFIENDKKWLQKDNYIINTQILTRVF